MMAGKLKAQERYICVETSRNKSFGGVGVPELTGFTLVIHVEVFGGAGTGVLPEQQVVDRQLTVSVALTLRQQLLHRRQRAVSIYQRTGSDVATF